MTFLEIYLSLTVVFLYLLILGLCRVLSSINARLRRLTELLLADKQQADPGGKAEGVHLLPHRYRYPLVDADGKTVGWSTDEAPG